MTVLRLFFQLLLYVPLMALIGYFSSYPRFTEVPAGQALLRLSIVHGTHRLQECRERTPEELAKLAPNMRAALDCPRERAPMVVELELDGRVVYRHSSPPSGLRRDGAAAVYHRMQLPAGAHRLVARLRDRPGEGFDYVRTADLDIAPGASLVVDFDAAHGGFVIKG